MKTRCLPVLLLLLLFSLPGLAEPAAMPLSGEDFLFEYAGKTFELGGMAELLIRAIEETSGPMEVYEADSCLFEGKDKEYANDELLIGTYPTGPGGTDTLETIYVLGGGHKTARDVGIGSAKTDVLQAYGDGYTLDYDQMIYAADDPLMDPLMVFVLDLETEQVISFYMLQNTTV